MTKPILCLDFDGVIHRYDSGWQDVEVISDPMTEGFWEWVEEAKKHFQIIVYSSRSKEDAGVVAMGIWLKQQRDAWRAKGNRPPEDTPLELSFTNQKPAAFLTIDDRALTFTGSWADFPPERLREFRPWNKRS